MCHSSKHTGCICIQDNETCHVNFILCLLALLVLSFFFALFPFFSLWKFGWKLLPWPRLFFMDHSNIQILVRCRSIIHELFWIAPFLLFYSTNMCSILHFYWFTCITYIGFPPTYCRMLPAATAGTNSGFHFGFFFISLLPLCLPSPLSFCKNIIRFQRAQTKCTYYLFWEGKTELKCGVDRPIRRE